MQDTVQRPATYADLEAVPPHLTAEILYGHLVTQPQPSRRHSRATSRINGILSGPFDLGLSGPGGWDFYTEPELHLGGHVVVPDIAGWRTGRLSGLAVEQVHIDIAPDWVCEILSPSTERRDRTVKRSIYAEFGVGHYWLLDPRLRLLEVHELRDGSWLLAGTFTDEGQVRAPPFDSLPFTLDQLLPEDCGTPD